MDIAVALGLNVARRQVTCFNGRAHQGGQDRHPSMVLFADTNRYKCMACGVCGDVIDLVRGVRNTGFGEAIRWIQSRFKDLSTAGPQIVKPRRRFPDENDVDVYAEMYQQTFEIDSQMPAGVYLHRRGVKVDVANGHHATQIGDAAELWSHLLGKFGEERLHSAGLVSQKGNFLFARHHLLFFYFDGDEPRFVQARDITGECQAKELMPSGVCSPVPYNVDLLRSRPSLVHICEGCIDTLSAIQLGYPAVGVPGVQAFKQEWFELFRGINHVRILFDGDDAGRRQARELVSQFRMRGIKADSRHPQGVKDMNELLVLKNNDGGI